MKQLYLTKQEDGITWYYVGDPIHPNTTFDVGMVEVPDRTEIRMDEFGIYVEREFVGSEETKTFIGKLLATL